MNKGLRVLLIFTLIISPFWTGMLMTAGQPPENLGGLVVFLGTILGTPLIAACGLICSVLTRKSAKANQYSVLGYLVPAALVCGYMLFVQLI